MDSEPNPKVFMVYLCYNGKGRFLLSKRSESEGKKERWGIGDCEIKLNESPVDTLKREIKDQYKIPMLEYGFLGSRFIYAEETKKKITGMGLDFKVRIDDNIKSWDPKFAAINWCGINGLPDSNEMTLNLRTFLEKYKEQLKLK